MVLLVVLSCVLGVTNGFVTRAMHVPAATPTIAMRSRFRQQLVCSAEASLDSAQPKGEDEQLPQIGSRYRVMGAPLTRQEHEEIGYKPKYANLKGTCQGGGRAV